MTTMDDQIQTIERFFEDLEDNNIIAKQYWTCCGNCGTACMWKEYSDKCDGFVFYHEQDHDIMMENNKNETYLNWGIFDKEPTDEEYELFAKKIKNIANSFNIEIKGTNFSKRLLMTIK